MQVWPMVFTDAATLTKQWGLRKCGATNSRCAVLELAVHNPKRQPVTHSTFKAWPTEEKTHKSFTNSCFWKGGHFRDQQDRQP